MVILKPEYFHHSVNQQHEKIKYQTTIKKKKTLAILRTESSIIKLLHVSQQ